MLLVNTKTLRGFKIHAIDGELGSADEFYFDDESWAIRYLIVKTGNWLDGRSVLISPISIVRVDWSNRHVDVSLTKDQVEHSPDINTHQPVSRQHEAAYLGYYGYPNYWGGPFLWGSGYSPLALGALSTGSLPQTAAGTVSADSHLRSVEEVTGYDIHANDGEIGHVSGFVMDDVTWAIRYLEVSTRNWWPGRKVLISPAWIKQVSWLDSKVYVDLSRESIQLAPEYIEAKPIVREYEDRLHAHHGMSPYWVHDTKNESYFSLSGRGG